MTNGFRDLPAAAAPAGGRVPHVNSRSGCVCSFGDGVVHSNLASIHLNPIALLLCLT